MYTRVYTPTSLPRYGSTASSLSSTGNNNFELGSNRGNLAHEPSGGMHSSMAAIRRRVSGRYNCTSASVCDGRHSLGYDDFRYKFTYKFSRHSL
eukprot:COSAG02_NODE_3176_length_7226_cov_3.027361_4_plen_93_part_01